MYLSALLNSHTITVLGLICDFMDGLPPIFFIKLETSVFELSIFRIMILFLISFFLVSIN